MESGEFGVVEDTLVLARLDGVLRVLKVSDLATFKKAGYLVEVYGVDEGLNDRFGLLEDILEHNCSEVRVLHVRGHGSISLCSNHIVPVVEPRSLLVEKRARDLKPGDYMLSFVKRAPRSVDYTEHTEEKTICPSSIEELALTMWTLRLSGVLSSLAYNRICLKTYSERGRFKLEKIPIGFFESLKQHLREVSRSSRYCRHVATHLGSRRNVSKHIALLALRDLMRVASGKSISVSSREALENLSRLVTSNLYVVRVSDIEVRREKRRSFAISADKAAYVFVGLAPLLVG
ncbi:MAG: hypothetical protein QXS85_00815 [Acidilobaceae archaeon]